MVFFRLLKPLKVFCVRFVRRVVVEWFGLNPCWVCERKRCGFVSVSIRCSVTLEGVQSNAIGLSEAASVGSLFGLRRERILPCFQIWEILECW